MRSVITLSFVLLTPLCEAGLQCQQAQSFLPGDHVRVYRSGVENHLWDRGGPDVYGTVLAVSSDSLVVLGRDGTTVHLALQAIRQIEVNRGPHSNWLMGMATGGVLGASAGLVTGLIVSFETQGCQTGFPLELSTQCQDSMVSILGAVGLGALAGALLGTTVGSFIKTDRWKAVSVGRGAVGIVAHRGRVGIVASLVF